MQTTLNPYLNFEGQAREAMEFYKSVLGGELTMQTWGEAKMGGPEDAERIMHAHLKSEGVQIMGADAPKGKGVKFGDNVTLSLVGSDEETLTEAFKKLSEGGKIMMPLEKAFWGDIFGMFTDKFGVNWMVDIGNDS